MRLVDKVLGRLVILQVDHLRLFGTHVQVLLLEHGQLVGRVLANIDHTGVEDQVLTFDTQQRAFAATGSLSRLKLTIFFG